MNNTIFRLTTVLALPALLLVGCNDSIVEEESPPKKAVNVETAEEPKKETPSEETNGSQNQNDAYSESSETEIASNSQQNEDQNNYAEKETNTTAFSQETPSSDYHYNGYSNARFGFYVQYPDSFIAGPEPDNGDGRYFDNGEAEIRAYGSIALDEDALQTEYQFAISDAVGPIAYQKTGDNWFAVSFIDDNNNIVYRKTILQNGILSTVILTYPDSQKAKYDALVSHVVSTFIPGNG
ncbi:hypothetical protein [Peribacillus asahii]|uniref:hypothetical protein n=1 Tax=Peribacillus asahii TaxID=228899 RepID=UPI0020794CB5|nr:hypothetical protein [Peribacillus asahii]USK58511.1 hypothetical protein LIT37_14810 [Peribacillus asahii]